MPTPQTLVNGLGGATGSSFKTLTNQLFFVEFDGKLARLDLLPAASILAQDSSQVIQGTYLFDFDTGTHSPDPGMAGDWDIWWQQKTRVERSMTPRNGAQLSYLGLVDFDPITFAELQSLTYSSAEIVADNNSSNLLVDGAVFAVKTTSGNYTKVQVLNYGYNIELRFVTYEQPENYHVLATGYQQPEDIVLSSDGQHAYITERVGNFIQVDLNNPDRVGARFISTRMNAPHQIALDEARGIAYTVEFAGSGRLLRIDLDHGTQTVMASGLEGAIGLLVTSDDQFAYISQQTASGGQLMQIELSSGRREVIATGLDNPFFMTWSDPGESAILITERDPANRVTKISLAEEAPVVSHLLTGVPARPSSIAVVNENTILICSDQEISKANFTESIYESAGPVFLGIGHVPFDRIINGYADTAVDPGYFFQVKDAPFGGTLPIMLNHEKAYADGARFYKLKVDGNEPLQSFNDYKWSTSINRFQLTTTTPDSNGYYPLRSPGQLWYNHWLGYRLNTLALRNGLHTISIEIYATNALTASPVSTHSLDVMIDNQIPLAVIDEIIHHHHTDGPTVVGTCGIVTENSDQFTFKITARDTEGHLKNWRLVALWGDNKSAEIIKQSYTPPADGSRRWNGLTTTIMPSPPWSATVPGDPTSRRCAHTFYLHVWDRVINGYHYIHKNSYHKSVTLLLP